MLPSRPQAANSVLHNHCSGSQSRTSKNGPDQANLSSRFIPQSLNSSEAFDDDSDSDSFTVHTTLNSSNSLFSRLHSNSPTATMSRREPQYVAMLPA